MRRLWCWASFVISAKSRILFCVPIPHLNVYNTQLVLLATQAVLAVVPRYSRIFNFSHPPNPKPTSICRQRITFVRSFVRSFDPGREIPPLPLFLPLLVYVTLSLSSSLSSKLPPIGILKFNSGAKAEATGWTDGRGRMCSVSTSGGGPLKLMAAQSLYSAVRPPSLPPSLPHSHVNATAAPATSAPEWMRQRGNYSSLVPSSSETSADRRPIIHRPRPRPSPAAAAARQPNG